MRSLALVAAGVLVGSYGAGRATAPGHLGADFTAGAVVGQPKGTMHAVRPGALLALHLDVIETGTGAGDLTVAVTVNGVQACSETFACATAPGDLNEDCAAEFSEGAEVHVELVTESCDMLPGVIGSLSYVYR